MRWVTSKLLLGAVIAGVAGLGPALATAQDEAPDGGMIEAPAAAVDAEASATVWDADAGTEAPAEPEAAEPAAEAAAEDAADEIDSAAILARADRSRGNIPGAVWNVELITGDGEKVDTVEFDVKVRNTDFFAEYLTPPRQKGNRLLMVGGNMWFYKPGLSKPVPISQRQKLSGNAAYGDISATNYADDYERERLPDETNRGELCYVFDLKAKPGRLTTYDRIRIWISKARGVSMRAEYYTVSGKLFKSVEVDHDQTLEVDGETIPFVSEARFVDELVTRETTTMRIRDPRSVVPDDSVFDVGFMTQ